jgi:phage terminase large subunit-like protein
VTLAQQLASLPKKARDELLGSLGPEAIGALNYAWGLWARPEQLAPPGRWRVWFYLGGRGSGKTRAMAEHIRSEVMSGRRRQVGIVGPTMEAVRRVMVEGPSGILAVSPPNERPTYEMSLGRLTWPNGAQAHLFSAEEPDRLRGPNFDVLWIDELCAFQNDTAVWDMSMMALRLSGPKGDPAQAVISTTPRPTALVKSIISQPDTVLTKSTTLANAANLDTNTLAYLQRKYANTTLGRQELEAEILDDIEGALWNRALLDACRVESAPDTRTRVVIAIDPSGNNGSADNAECGIIVAALGRDNHGYVLADASARLSPERWARRGVDLYEQYRADKIIAEQNFGGAMVENTIKMVAQYVPVKLVQASRGKAVRAEPVVALYEQRRVHHVGVFQQLEDQLCQWVPGSGGPSPDRLDALVWAISELMVENTSSLALWAAQVGKGPIAERFLAPRLFN